MIVDKSGKRDLLFLLLSGIFITSLILGNIIGASKFVSLFSFVLPDWILPVVPSLVRDQSLYVMSVPVGVLAYPVTFLATDLISEIFGRVKAQLVVIVGFIANMFMLLVMSIGHWLPNTYGVSGGLNLFEGVYDFMIVNTLASMIAYLTAQTIDVELFHFWKTITKGKQLWVRNNLSTMVSQLVDSTAILSILYMTGNLGATVSSTPELIILIMNSYIFKFFFALLDTPFFYAGVYWLKRYREDPEFVAH